MRTKVLLTASMAVLAAALPTASSMTSTSATPSCTKRDCPAPVNYDGTYTDLTDLNVSGSFNISAALCAPTVHVANRSNTLEVLVHGISYTKTYWSGLEVPPNSFNGSTYSWVDYAASQGYWTLAIDRLCNGNSSHPNPSDICQIPAEAATVHSLVKAAKAGRLFPRSKAFDKVICNGHSYGSLIGNYYANTYTAEVDALVLIGYSSSLINSFDAQLVSAVLEPANLVLTRDSSLPAPYLTFLNEHRFEGLFFYGDYDQSVVDMNFRERGTVTFGELLSVTIGLGTAPNVTIPVYVINGQEDQVFCSVSVVDSIYGYRGQCGTGPDSLVARTKELFPNTSNYGYGVVAESGHCFNLHYSAIQGFEETHRYLASQGF